ncbi:hypothetical protein [Niallia oryzisoli]|uniref:hypothetical protein n=1 Tax=Niallia oryzisoli TaxID=1737571 RepID=UPI003736609A
MEPEKQLSRRKREPRSRLGARKETENEKKVTKKLSWSPKGSRAGEKGNQEAVLEPEKKLSWRKR